MLNLLRRKAQSTYIQGTILILVLVFVFWGVGSSQKGGPDAIATVNDQNISARQYQKNYTQTINRYQEQFGGTLPAGLLEALNLKQQVLDQMIQELVMQQSAKEAGLIVSSDEIRKVIQNMEAFREAGIFKLDRYKTLLASSRMSTTDFENSVRSDLLNTKIIGHLSRFARISDSELKDRFAFDNDQLKLEYVAFNVDDFRNSGPIAEQDLEAFFDSRKQAYLTEPQVKLRYITFLNKQVVESSQLSDQGKDLTFQLANQAYEGIILAGSLDKYAASTATPVQKTDYFTQSQPPTTMAEQPALLKTIFALKKGELSSLLEIKGGYAIVYLDEVKEPQVPPLAEVRARVEKDFLDDQAKTRARNAAVALLTQAKKEPSFIAAAEKTKSKVLETSFFTRSQQEASGLPGPVAAQGLKLSAASPYAKEVGENGGTFYVLHFKESKPASEEAFAGQKETLQKMLTQEKQRQVMGAWLVYLQSRAKITTDKKFME